MEKDNIIEEQKEVVTNTQKIDISLTDYQEEKNEMALIICPECGKEVSDKAPHCIHCGYPLDLENRIQVSDYEPESNQYTESSDRTYRGSFASEKARKKQSNQRLLGKERKSTILSWIIVILLVVAVISAVTQAIINSKPYSRTVNAIKKETITQTVDQKISSSTTSDSKKTETNTSVDSSSKSKSYSNSTKKSEWTPPDNPCVWCGGTGWGNAHKENGIVVVDSYCTHCNGTGKR